MQGSEESVLGSGTELGADRTLMRTRSSFIRSQRNKPTAGVSVNLTQEITVGVPPPYRDGDGVLRSGQQGGDPGELVG